MFSFLRQLIIVSFLGLWQLLIGWLFSAPVKYSVDEALWEVALCALPSVQLTFPRERGTASKQPWIERLQEAYTTLFPRTLVLFSFFLPFLSSTSLPHPFTQSIALMRACLSAHPYMTHTGVFVCLENNLKGFLNSWVFPCFLSFFKGIWWTAHRKIQLHTSHMESLSDRIGVTKSDLRLIYLLKSYI